MNSIQNQMIEAESNQLMLRAESEFKEKQKKTAKKNQQMKIFKEKWKKMTYYIESFLFGKDSEQFNYVGLT